MDEKGEELNMQVTLKRDGTTVVAGADRTAMLKTLAVLNPAAKLEILVESGVEDGRPFWEMTVQGASYQRSRSSEFGALWGDIPGSVVGPNGECFPILAVVAEIVDASGRVSHPKLGMSAEKTRCLRALERFTRRFQGREMVELLRTVLAKHGYSAKPDLALIKVAGDCVAYHELAGAILDKYDLNSSPEIEDLFATANEFSKLNDAMWDSE
jgi:hypothetical protein